MHHPLRAPRCQQRRPPCWASVAPRQPGGRLPGSYKPRLSHQQLLRLKRLQTKPPNMCASSGKAPCTKRYLACGYRLFPFDCDDSAR